MNSPAIEKQNQAKAGAPRRKLSVHDYHRMGDTGILREDDRVELIDGELFAMAPVGCPHAAAVARLTMWFAGMASKRYLVWVQNPIQIPPFSEPQPDLMLLRPRPDGYSRALPQPTDVLLLIEVAVSSLAFDRDLKIPLYGRHGIAESWLVNMQRRAVTVYRDPAPEGYRSIVEVRQATVSPACFGDLTLEPDEIFGVSDGDVR
jgi:Uma2 family endonuclease